MTSILFQYLELQIFHSVVLHKFINLYWGGGGNNCHKMFYHLEFFAIILLVFSLTYMFGNDAFYNASKIYIIMKVLSKTFMNDLI